MQGYVACLFLCFQRIKSEKVKWLVEKMEEKIGIALVYQLLIYELLDFLLSVCFQRRMKIWRKKIK